jgi:hypothetical protein
MAEDEIERLLREINATSGTPAAQPPATTPEKTVATTETGRAGGGLAFASIAAVTLGGATIVGALLTPFTDNFWTAVGAAGGAFVTGLVSGPPRWFSS